MNDSALHVLHDLWLVFPSDSENPAEKEDPTFKLSKVHSASTVISNLSLKSASMESDLDAMTNDTEVPSRDVKSIGGSSMRAKNSITARPVKSEAQPSSELYNLTRVQEAERRSLRALSKSQPLLASRNHSNTTSAYSSFNGHVRSSKTQSKTSSVVDHSRNSSLPDPSDSDIDSYSDIVGQRSWKDPVSHQSVDLSVTSSNSRQAVPNGYPRSWASSSNPAGSVITFPVQQRRVIEDAARTPKQISTSTPKQSYEPVMNGTNHSNINGDGLQRGSSLNEDGTSRGRPQRRSRSESQDPALQNGSRSVGYNRSKSIPRLRENGSSDEEDAVHVRERRRLKSSTDLRTNRVITAVDRTHNDRLTDQAQLRVSNVDLPASSSSNRPAPLRNGEYKVNHADQLAAEMGRRDSLQGRRQSLPKFRDDSQSSQDSTDYESRQTAAERAAAALMSNHVTHVPPAQPLTSKRTTPQPFEMKDMTVDTRRLRREHLANLAHLQSSSC